MKSTQQSVLVHGVVGGLLAGAIVALWFLVVDLVAGDPLRTPAELGGALFGRVGGGTATTVALYSLLHFATFAVVGGVTGWFLDAAGVAPRLALGLFFGVCVLTAIHYVGLLLTGEHLLGVLPAGHVVGANLLSGLALMAYLHRVEKEEHPLGWAALRYHPLIAEGLKLGVVGALAVAAWFFFVDLVAGSPLRTPAALGSALFLGPEATLDAATPAIVAAYSVLHLVAFGLVGIAFAAIARGVEQLPSLAFFVVLGAIVLEALTFSALVAFGGWVLGGVSVWAVGVANLLAFVAMGTWVWRSHPGLREGVLREGLAGAA
ncbi:MAG: hypothetical protein MJB57_12515 [Gemmatimonadetes bacterium]|nr:hypothetical protein [Gemmatimonadota bacterium]